MLASIVIFTRRPQRGGVELEVCTRAHPWSPYTTCVPCTAWRPAPSRLEASPQPPGPCLMWGRPCQAVDGNTAAPPPPRTPLAAVALHVLPAVWALVNAMGQHHMYHGIQVFSGSNPARRLNIYGVHRIVAATVTSHGARQSVCMPR